MRRFQVILFCTLLILLSFVACGQEKSSTLRGENLQVEETAKEVQNAHNAKLGEEPILTLTDLLSSQMNQLTLFSGNYSWNWEGKKPGEMQSAIACGFAPLDYAGMEGVTRLKLVDYNGMEGVPYLISGDVRPDVLTVRRWDSSAIGDVEVEPLSVETYTSDNLLVELLPDSVYEFAAVWSEENLEEYGVYGEASFVLVTE